MIISRIFCLHLYGKSDPSLNCFWRNVKTFEQDGETSGSNLVPLEVKNISFQNNRLSPPVKKLNITSWLDLVTWDWVNWKENKQMKKINNMCFMMFFYWELQIKRLGHGRVKVIQQNFVDSRQYHKLKLLQQPTFDDSLLRLSVKVDCEIWKPVTGLTSDRFHFLPQHIQG